MDWNGWCTYHGLVKSLPCWLTLLGETEGISSRVRKMNGGWLGCRCNSKIYVWYPPLNSEATTDSRWLIRSWAELGWILLKATLLAFKHYNQVKQNFFKPLALGHLFGRNPKMQRIKWFLTISCWPHFETFGFGFVGRDLPLRNSCQEQSQCHLTCLLPCGGLAFMTTSLTWFIDGWDGKWNSNMTSELNFMNWESMTLITQVLLKWSHEYCEWLMA